jgi:SAM-dependent methyltransferase
MTIDELDALVAENRRLVDEVGDLRGRVRALESSRWHRLRPRRLLRRRAPSPPTAAVPASRPAAVDPRLATFRDEVVRRGIFSQDWVTPHVDLWEPVIRTLEGRESRILEIGSYEGLSACYLLWRLPDATITCVDTFAGSPRLASLPRGLDFEENFDANVALVDAARVRKVVGDSRRVLLDLVSGEARFDLVYVDGSHLGLDVMVDAAYSWRLLAPAGVLLFDDYGYRDLGEDPLLRPAPAIDAFLSLIECKYEELFRGYQVAVRKVRVEP